MDWLILATVALGTSVGILMFALLVFGYSLLTGDEYRIPMHHYLLKSLAVFPICWAIWIIPALLLVCSVHFMVPIDTNMIAFASFVIGLVIPNLVWLSYLPINPSDKQEITDSYARVFGAMVNLKEWTSGYVDKIIKREEREQLKKSLPNGPEAGVLRAFEFHVVEIAEQASATYGDPNPFNLFKIRNPHIKNWHLLRYLGFRRWTYLLEQIRNDASIIYPEWSDADLERRNTPDRRIQTSVHSKQAGVKREMPWGRRKSDLPYTGHYILKNKH